jgi:hypothetical protein
MRYIVFLFCIFTKFSFSAEILKSEKLRSYSLEKISFDGHTYIYLSNPFSSNDRHFIHDPGCSCTKFDFENFKRIREELKRSKVKEGEK